MKNQLSQHFEIIGFSIYNKEHKLVVISDLHIGFEEALNKDGILVPRSLSKKNT